MNRKTWHPPGSLIGPHWEIQLRHVVSGQWVTYTEHGTPEAAHALAERFGTTADYRVVEVTP